MRTYRNPIFCFYSVFSFSKNFVCFCLCVVCCRGPYTTLIKIVSSNIVIYGCTFSIFLEFNYWILTCISLIFLYFFDLGFDRFSFLIDFRLVLIYFNTGGVLVRFLIFCFPIKKLSDLFQLSDDRSNCFIFSLPSLFVLVFIVSSVMLTSVFLFFQGVSDDTFRDTCV